MRKHFVLLLISLITVNSFSKEGFKSADYRVAIFPTAEQVRIDGELNEQFWGNAIEIGDFWMHSPVDTAAAPYQTLVKISYDAENIYIGAVCYDTGEENIVQSLKRDNEHLFWRSDAFSVVMDPSNSQKNGFFFGVNAAGAQIEGLLSANGNWTRLDANWNTKWYSETSRKEDHFVIEMVIPFSSINYNAKNTTWRMNFIRNDMRSNVYSTWTNFETNFQSIDLGHTGEIELNKIPEKSGSKFILIPAAVGGIAKDFEDGSGAEFQQNISLDSKVSITSSLNLDLTVNPDFSNADADAEVTNLSRFSIFMPEKRNFFLENSDLFSNLGTSEARPIFTRNIGLYDGETVPILFGARLSGNIMDRTRIGVMNVQTNSKDDINAQNYAVTTIQQGVFKRSSIRTFIVNRQAIANQEMMNDDFNRVGGVELDLLSEDGKWRAMGIYHSSYTEEDYSKNSFYNGGVSYNSRYYNGSLWFNRVEQDFIADVGFTPRLENYDYWNDTVVRLGYKQFINRNNVRIYGKPGSIISTHRFGYDIETYLNDDNSLNELQITGDYFLNLVSRNDFMFRVKYWKVNLPYAVAFISDKEPLPAQMYEFGSAFLRYMSDSRKLFNYNLSAEYGSFYNGRKTTFGLDLNYRFQPWVTINFDYKINFLKFPKEYGEKDLHLLSLRADIAFSKNMFLSNFLQFNTQAERFSVNSRFQWRFKPMSDLFLVFTDNINSFDLSQKNYGLILKVSYWFNV